MYNDGHKREDVVEYRQERFFRMMTYKRLIETCEGDHQRFVIDSVLEIGERKHIL